MWPRQRSNPNRRSVLSRTVSRWISRSRSIASWPIPPGAFRSASRRSERSAIVCSRLVAMAAKCASSPAIRTGSALAWRWSGRSNALVLTELTTAVSLRWIAGRTGDSAAPPGPCRKPPPALYLGERGRTRWSVLCCVPGASGPPELVLDVRRAGDRHTEQVLRDAEGEQDGQRERPAVAGVVQSADAEGADDGHQV